MSLIKRLILCTIIVYIVYGLVHSDSLDSIEYTNAQNNQTTPKHNNYFESHAHKGLAFSINFVDPKKYQEWHKGESNYYKVYNTIGMNKELLANEIDNNMDASPNSFNMNFELGVSGGVGQAESDNLNNGSNLNIVINDTEYSNQNKIESDIGYGETIFVTDDIENKLISCKEQGGKYNCHTAISNLNRPQDILIVKNNIYIINQHKYGERGDITKCNINSRGYIDSCGQAPINITNPIFFYYRPPSIFISDFVYSGGSRKPAQALQCIIDGNGNFTNCHQDHDSLSMSYISKFYNNQYYRPYSYRQPSAIELCSMVDDVLCLKMTNELLVYPLSLSINHARIFISNAKAGSTPADILKCSLDMKKCSVVTQEIKSPICIGVFNFDND